MSTWSLMFELSISWSSREFSSQCKYKCEFLLPSRIKNLVFEAEVRFCGSEEVKHFSCRSSSSSVHTLSDLLSSAKACVRATLVFDSAEMLYIARP